MGDNRLDETMVTWSWRFSGLVGIDVAAIDEGHVIFYNKEFF